MRRVAIVDDDARIRDQLQSYFAQYSENHKEQFQLSVFSFAELFLTNYKPVYDIVMMDIDMPGMNGLEAAHRLRKLDERAVLLFVTNLAQYAINGYEVSATDFIVKPVSYRTFEYKLTRALKYVPEGGRPMLLLKTETGLATVAMDDVKYVEVEGHNVFYHTEKEVYRARGSLKQTEQELNDPQFFMCDKCCLVNLAYVEAVNGSMITVGGEELSVSRPKKKAFMDALAAYHNKK